MKKAMVVIAVVLLAGCGETKTQMQVCADEMARMSQPDIERECSKMSGDEIIEASKIAHQINPAVIINIDDARTEKTGAAKETATIAATQPSLGITPQQYKEQFNAASVATDDSPFEIGELNIQKGEIFDTAQVRLTANNALILAVTKQGLVNSVSTISTGDGTLNSGLNMLKISIVVIRSVNTKMSKEAAYKMGIDLFTRAGKSNGKSVPKVVDGVKYYAILSDTLGYWFGAEIPQGTVDNK